LDPRFPEAAEVFGFVENHALPTYCRFEWGRTKVYGHITEVPEENAYNGKYPVGCEKLIEPLKPNTTYHYRLLAINAGGKSFGKDRTFHTRRR
jgi:hypothetical protein